MWLEIFGYDPRKWPILPAIPKKNVGNFPDKTLHSEFLWHAEQMHYVVAHLTLWLMDLRSHDMSLILWPKKLYSKFQFRFWLQFNWPPLPFQRHWSREINRYRTEKRTRVKDCASRRGTFMYRTFLKSRLNIPFQLHVIGWDRFVISKF